MYLTIMHVLMSDTILGLGMHQLKKPELLDHETYILVVLVIQLCLTFATPWIVAHQAPLSIGILQARTLEWVAMASSSGSFLTQGLNLGLLHCR